MGPGYGLYLLVSVAILGATMVATLATALIILRQATLLGQQNQVNALIELQREWESPRMHFLRSRWAAETTDLGAVEPILEFLEEFAGFRKREVLNNELIWDTTIGWHAVHYYFYNDENGNIENLRSRWRDKSLFQNLEVVLWPAYIENECKERGMNEEGIKQELRETKSCFVEAEKECNAHRLSESPN